MARKSRTQVAPGVTELIINTVPVTIVTKAAIRKHGLKAGELKWLTGNKYLYTLSFNRDDLFTAAGYNTNKIDFAVPQSWAELPKIRSRYAKGDRACWSYEQNKYAGDPVWDSDAWRKLRVIIKRRLNRNK